jgi:ribonuclease P protein component
MNRRFRLSSSADFKRVRRNGRSYAHPFVVLITSHGEPDRLRFGVSAGRSLGNAVQRNRAKRRLREQLRQFEPQLQRGWDVVLIARKALPEASAAHLQRALQDLFEKAGLLKVDRDHAI